MFLRLYDVNRSTIQFHEKLLPAQGKSDKCFQINKELGWFLFFSSELPYKSLFTEELFKIPKQPFQKDFINNLKNERRMILDIIRIFKKGRKFR